MSIKLLQQIWRIVGLSLVPVRMLIPGFPTSDQICRAAKQLNRTLYVQRVRSKHIAYKSLRTSLTL